MRKGTKRKAREVGKGKSKQEEETNTQEQTATTEQLVGESVQEEPKKNEKGVVVKGRAKRAKIVKPDTQTEYFPDKRNLEDLWQEVFPVGTEDAFEEGGELHGKKVYLFGCTEPQLVFFQGQSKVTCIPVVVAVVSPFPPSDKIGINSVQREAEEILPMKQMKMDWVPYIPLEKRESQVERLKSQIFILRCTQRRSASLPLAFFFDGLTGFIWAGLKHLKLERVKKFEYCLPYFYQPFAEDEFEQSTIVQILFPTEPPVFCEFDWEFDEPEAFVKEKVKEGKKSNREAREARKKAIQEMSEEAKAAFQSMKFYKFYPVTSPDAPDVSQVKILWEGSQSFLNDASEIQIEKIINCILKPCNLWVNTDA
ncbi:hypothetical protein RND71_014687 [Anisodus tanguticus]|uniref:Uncharacterized protein n=1 Tax=Anisodus tanguticus TaxID=243964 RepID=A0AAE1SBZ1_9SOLA|nr:hypothetical protein RND71_014687 [Anisodus tanguticus]